MVHYKLSYFPSRGAAEIIRQVFAVAGVEYDDERIPRDQWPDRKAGMPFGQIPVLEVDGKQLAQSGAILRYVARQFGLAGKTPFEEALVDSLYDQYKDYMNEARPYFRVAMGFTEGDKEALFKDVAVGARDKFFTILKNWLAKSGAGYLVGDSLTYVDLAIAEHVSSFREVVPDVADNYPEVVEHAKKVRENANLAKWLEMRPKTQY